MGEVKTEIMEYFSKSQAADILGVSRQTIWRWIKEGKIQLVEIGGFELIPRSNLEQIVKERKQEAAVR